MRSEGTPVVNSQTTAFVAVFPDPTTTNLPGASAKLARSLTATTWAPSATSTGGPVVAGIVGDR